MGTGFLRLTCYGVSDVLVFLLPLREEGESAVLLECAPPQRCQCLQFVGLYFALRTSIFDIFLPQASSIVYFIQSSGIIFNSF